MSRKLPEERTRKEIIDPSALSSIAGRRPDLEAAGWFLRDHAKEQAKAFDYVE